MLTCDKKMWGYQGIEWQRARALSLREGLATFCGLDVKTQSVLFYEKVVIVDLRLMR